MNMISLKKIYNKRVFQHIAFWIFFLLFIFIEESKNENFILSFNELLEFSIGFLGFAFVSYFNLYFLIPRLFKKKKYLLYTALLVLSIFLTSLLLIFALESVFEHIKKVSDNDSYIFLAVHLAFSATVMVALSTFFHLLRRWIKMQDMEIKLKDMEKEKIFAELSSLKSQINPHFFFNSLNNIYALSIDKSDKTPAMILKLSDLMSYILYDCKSERVEIKKEIEFIRNYIELEKERFGDILDIKLTINVFDSDIQIAPLLFIPFIENAIKHGGNNESLVKNISLSLTLVKPGKLTFTIVNLSDSTNDIIDDNKNGIGIENVKKRLELIYADKYNLEIEKDKVNFKVKLTIDLNGN